MAAQPGRRRRGRAATAAVVVAALTAGSVGGWVAALVREPDVVYRSSPSTTEVTGVQLSGQTMDAAAIVDSLEASVVSIETTVLARQGPFATEGIGAGTGIVIDDEGHILTNAHVLADAQQVTVTLAGESQGRTAEVVGIDEDSDIAVLDVDDAEGLVPANLGSAADLQVGDDVVAIGNALALEGGLTVTRGICSALERELQAEIGTLSGLIQTDAAISSGNSGGPLVNANGEVVGINTAVASSNGSVEAANIGFAIPIDTAMELVEQMLATTA